MYTLQGVLVGFLLTMTLLLGIGFWESRPTPHNRVLYLDFDTVNNPKTIYKGSITDMKIPVTYYRNTPK